MQGRITASWLALLILAVLLLALGLVTEREATTSASTRSAADSSYAAQLAALTAVAPATIWSDDQKLAQHIESLRSLANLLEEEPDTADLGFRTQVQTELARWIAIARIKAQCDYVDACLRKLDQDPGNIASDLSVSVLQAAENALPQFWGEDLGVAPAALAAKIKAYPTRIVDWSAKI